MLKSSLILICFVIFSSFFIPLFQHAGVLLILIIAIPLGSLLASRYSQKYILPASYGIIMGAWLGKAMFLDHVEKVYYWTPNIILNHIIIGMIVIALSTCLLCVSAWFAGQQMYWNPESSMADTVSLEEEPV